MPQEIQGYSWAPDSTCIESASVFLVFLVFLVSLRQYISRIRMDGSEKKTPVENTVHLLVLVNTYMIPLLGGGSCTVYFHVSAQIGQF